MGGEFSGKSALVTGSTSGIGAEVARVLAHRCAQAPTEDMSLEQFDRIIAVNYRGLYAVTRAAIPHLRASGSGRIVNITTIGAYKGFPGGSVYNSSKAAVENLTRTWALELAPDVTVNSVVPGMIDAPMSEGPRSQMDVEQMLLPVIPKRRLGTPADVAHAVAFLAGPGADYITGGSLAVDGGLLAS